MALKKTHAQFRNAVSSYELTMMEAGKSEMRLRLAAYAMWWFIENVTPEDPSRTEIFFKLREMVRGSDL